MFKGKLLLFKVKIDKKAFLEKLKSQRFVNTDVLERIVEAALKTGDFSLMDFRAAQIEISIRHFDHFENDLNIEMEIDPIESPPSNLDSEQNNVNNCENVSLEFELVASEGLLY